MHWAFNPAEKPIVGSNPTESSMRKTIASWEELCELIKQFRAKGESITLRPITWYGSMEKDRKSKQLASHVGGAHSITFEVEVM